MSMAGSFLFFEQNGIVQPARICKPKIFGSPRGLGCDGLLASSFISPCGAVIETLIIE
jgi:hypothetical protein